MIFFVTFLHQGKKVNTGKYVTIKLLRIKSLILKNNIMDGKIINIDPEILGGTPVFFGTRVPIKNLFDYLETGDSIETFLEDFEGVQKSQVLKLLEMSQKLIESSTNILNENFA